MFKPTLEEFKNLAKSYNVVPIWTELMADTQTPVTAFIRLVGDRDGFLLESVDSSEERWNRFSFVGRNPLATVVSKDNKLELTGEFSFESNLDGGIFDFLETLLSCYKSPVCVDLPPLHGGLVGYLGYDVVREIENLPPPPTDDLGYPDAIMSIIGQLAAFDHWRQKVFLIENVIVDPNWQDGDYEQIYLETTQHLAKMAEELSLPIEEKIIQVPKLSQQKPDYKRSFTDQEYEKIVEKAKEYIKAGDIFQVALSQRFDLELQADPFDLYRILRQINPSPYMYFLRYPQLTLVGSSPERMVQVLDNKVRSTPIAGTRPRGKDDEQDKQLGQELIQNPKEIAEHVMLVDLARNDIGRVAKYGTEHLEDFMALERFSHVMHITSQVIGDLDSQYSSIDVLRATFPAGTVSGAPKVRAMEIISELESRKRGLYSGVVGYLDFSGNLDVAIAIRTMVVSPEGIASIQAGAGIVFDSDPVAENIECSNKASALLSAVIPARGMTKLKKGFSNRS